MKNHSLTGTIPDPHKLNFTNTIELMKNHIDKFTSDYNLELEIGGPKTVINIGLNEKPTCIENCENLVWSNWNDMKEYLKNNIEEVKLVNCRSNEEAIEILNRYR